MADLTTKELSNAEIERVLLGGDLAKLTPDQRLSYYNSVCKSLALNPLTRPFDYIVLNGKMQLYAKKDCTDQLRVSRGVSVESVQHVHQPELGIYVVTAIGTDRGGRKDTGTGAVNVAGKKGDDLANAIMKAETKAKRRLTLSLCGLGLLDETEIETIKGAKVTAGAISNRVVTGKIDQIKVTDHGITGIKIGKEKLWVSDPAVDSQLAAAEGQDVSVEAAERPGTSGKPYWEIVRVLKIRNYDFTQSDNLVPQLEASMEQELEFQDNSHLGQPAPDSQTLTSGVKVPF